MTKGIEKSGRKKLKLYKETLKKSSSDRDIDKYKQYRNVYNHTKRAAMHTYYMSQAEAYKKNTKEPWKLINNK